MSTLSNINTIGVMCGWVLSIAKPADDTNSALLQAGSKWSQDISVCASTTKVSVKTVSFSYNATSTEKPLHKDLQITSIAPKHYTHSVHQPTWGVESANMSMYNSQPLWGIVDPLKITSVNEPNDNLRITYLRITPRSLSSPSLNTALHTFTFPAT